MIHESYGIERVNVSALTAFSGNPRTHSDTQIDQIAASIREFGWTNPILVDAAGVIIAGHGRLTDAGGKWSTFIIWAKNTFTLGRADYQRQYEPILYGWKQGADHFWCGARDQGDVWFVDKPRVNDLHPTMKPIELIERAIRNSSKSRDIVLDLFGGSGTTLIAAERTGRSARLLELDPKYVDVIVERWQNLTGGVAVLDGEDRTYDDLKAARGSKAKEDT